MIGAIINNQNLFKNNCVEKLKYLLTIKISGLNLIDNKFSMAFLFSWQIPIIMANTKGISEIFP